LKERGARLPEKEEALSCEGRWSSQNVAGHDRFERVFSGRNQTLGRSPPPQEFRRYLRVAHGGRRQLICGPIECASLVINARLYWREQNPNVMSGAI
jgi:hypothetical protein